MIFKKKFLSTEEELAVVQKITELEAKTSAEIHVHVTQTETKQGILLDAAACFKRLQLGETSHKSGVLIYIAEKSHTLAVYGDETVIKKIGRDKFEEFCRLVVLKMTENFRVGRRLEGVLYGVQVLGDLLVAELPDSSVQPSELSNEITHS